MGAKNIYERFIWFESQVKKKRYPNASSLAAQFEVSSKTAQRDIEFMRERLDCPLIYDAIRKGYFYDDETFSLPVVHLSSNELSSLIMARKLLRDISSEALAGDVDSAVQKITSIIEKHSKAPDGIEKALSFHLIRYSPAPEKVFKTMLEACLKKKSVSCTYASPARAERVERVIDPYHIFNYMGTWHVMGHCHLRKEIRDFHMNRIGEPQMIDEAFSIPRSFNFDEYFASSFGLYKGKETQEVVLRFSPESARWITGQVWHKDQVEKTLQDGSLELSFPVSGFAEISREILRHGAGVEVVRPRELKSLIRQELQQAIKQYE
ncbi:MAG: WYL domain-containing protein [Thermodesulfovibrionales bacterium]